MSSAKLLGGVFIFPLGKEKFGSNYCGTAVLNKDKVNKNEIKKENHVQVFDGVEWRVKWKPKDGEVLDRLCNKVAKYVKPKCAKVDYENELQDWINQKRLLQYDKNEIVPRKKQFPLIAVIQRNKENNPTCSGLGR